jgi:hypothetical protein
VEGIVSYSDYVEQCIPDTIRPAQFADLWKGSGQWSGAQKLALAILEQAVEDLQHRSATRAANRRLFSRAYSWFSSYDRSHLYSFVSVCDTLNLSSEAIRARLLSPFETMHATTSRTVDAAWYHSNGRIDPYGSNDNVEALLSNDDAEVVDRREVG